MSLNPEQRLVWVDIETFGLNPDEDPILEIGVCITDLDLSIIASTSILVWDDSIYNRAFSQLAEQAAKDDNAATVFDMHTNSGLLDDARKRGVKPAHAERTIAGWLKGQGVTLKVDPMCGSSVHFDREFLRAQMPAIDRLFSYRNIDVSSFKEACKRHNPRMFSYMEKDVKPQKKHRVIPDIQDSLAEYKWYVDNFFFVAP